MYLLTVLISFLYYNQINEQINQSFMTHLTVLIDKKEKGRQHRKFLESSEVRIQK